MSAAAVAPFNTFAGARHVAQIRAPFNAAGGQVVKHVCACGWQSDWWGIGLENTAIAELRAHSLEMHGTDPAKLRRRETIRGSH